MKKLLSIVLLSLLATVYSQEILKIEYECKMLMDEKAVDEMLSNIKTDKEGPLNPEIGRALVEAMNKPSYYELRLNAQESQFKMIERISNEQPNESNVHVEIMAGGSGVAYKNINENLFLRAEEGFGKNFIIEDELREYGWKITRETKEILGYEVRKATAEVDEDNTIEAWYAPKLPYKNGPKNYQGLPGLILEIVEIHKKETGESKYLHLAVSIEIDKDQSEIKPPHKGQKISQEDYLKLMNEHMEKMREMQGSGVDKN